MSFLTDLLDLMPDTVIHASVVSRDEYGKPSHGAGVSYRGRVSYKNSMAVSMRGGGSGQTVSCRGFVIIAGLPVIDQDDNFTLPDGTVPIIQAWDQTGDEHGPLYTKIFFT